MAGYRNEINLINSQAVKNLKKYRKLTRAFFWIIPVFYFTISQPDLVTSSKINSFSTPEIQEFNKATGSIRDVPLMKGFWFDYLDLNQDGKFEYLMQPWRDHILDKKTQVLGYILFVTSVAGLVIHGFSKRFKWRFSPLIFFVAAYFMLATTNPPLGFVYSFLADNISLFDEMFRSVFTKWSIPFGLVIAFGIGSAINLICSISKRRVGSVVALLVVPFVLLASVWFVKPAYKEDLIHRYMRINIPNEYFEMFGYFKSKPEQSRIAHFPVYSFWGWSFYDWPQGQPHGGGGADWDYRGSGFLWYGIKQPILDRAFDVWSQQDESFYHQVSYALSADDIELLGKVLDKYDVSYILFDESIIVPNSDKKLLKNEETQKMLIDLGWRVDWQTGFLTVYESSDSSSSFVDVKNATPTFESTSKVRRDLAYSQIGDYWTAKRGNGSFYYPFQNLLADAAIREGIEYKDDFDGHTWVSLSTTVDMADSQTKLVIPGVPHLTRVTMPAHIGMRDKDLVIRFSPPLRGDAQLESFKLPNVQVRIPRMIDQAYISVGETIFPISQGQEVDKALTLTAGEPIRVLVFDANQKTVFDLSESFYTSNVNKCWNREGTDGNFTNEIKDDVLAMSVTDAAACFSVKVGRISSPRVGLLQVSLPYQSYKGSKPHFCIVAEGPEYKCLNDEIFYNTVPEEGWTAVSRDLILDSSKTYWIEIAARPSDEPGETWQIDYKAPIVNAFSMVADVEFDSAIWETLMSEMKLDDANIPQDFSVDVLTKPVKMDFSRSGLVTPKNCDILERGDILKEVIDDKVHYTSLERSAACDYVGLLSLSTHKGYLLRLRGESRQGRPLKLYLYNKATGKIDIEALVDKGVFDNSYVVVDWQQFDEDSYVINLETRSFGRPSVAIIESVTFYEFPIDWLLFWQTQNNLDIVGASNPDYPEVLATKTGTHKYIVSLESNLGDNGIITLSQGYEDEWVAYQINSRMGEILPFVSGHKLEHVEVNGWANGWLLGPLAVSRQPLDQESNSYTTLIVYWPQYLEYLGFLILGVAAVALVIPSKVWRRRSRDFVS